MDTLCDDCIIRIFTHLERLELFNIFNVCKRFKELSVHEEVWHAMCIKEKKIKYKTKSMNWKSMFLLDDWESLCPHLATLANENLPPLFSRMENATWEKQKITCSAENCPYTYNSLWMCTYPGCYHIGCGRRDNAHATIHSENNPHAISMKLNTMELWCYTCRCWPGCLDRHAVEQERVAEIHNMFSEYCRMDYSRELFQRRKKERNLPFVECTRHKAVVPSVWNKKWERFIIGDIDDFKDFINTEILLNNEGTDVAPNLSYQRDCIVISIEAWVYLSDFYGSGPLISYDFLGRELKIGADPKELMQQNQIFESMVVGF